MRNLKLTSVIIFTFCSTVVFAGRDCKDKIKNSDVLTQEQIALRIRQCEDLQPKQDAFKSTFTTEQKAIRKDKSLSKKDKKEKLQSTFSPEQNAMKEEIKAIKKENRKAFKDTLTKEQKATLKARRQEN
tara:strand:- start:12 stop:398 length:387 start_codon:yes stop_codon:yes gene_type:complete